IARPGITLNIVDSGRSPWFANRCKTGSSVEASATKASFYKRPKIPRASCAVSESGVTRLDWQMLITLSLVAVSAGYLAYRGWTALFGHSTGCGTSCSRCPSSSSSKEPKVFTLEDSSPPSEASN
ncbi:MAG: hypothetical protein N2C14_12575, partial [Planctomycetales bacterium]